MYNFKYNFLRPAISEMIFLLNTDLSASNQFYSTTGCNSQCISFVLCVLNNTFSFAFVYLNIKKQMNMTINFSKSLIFNGLRFYQKNMHFYALLSLIKIPIRGDLNFCAVRQGLSLLRSDIGREKLSCLGVNLFRANQLNE